MYFERISIKNFGPFNEFQTNFNPTGINLIIGPNESGKTQLIGAIVVALFGSKSIRHSSSGNSETPSTLELIIREDGIVEFLRLDMTFSETMVEEYRRITRGSHFADMHSLRDQVIEHLLAVDKPAILFNSKDDIGSERFSSERYAKVDRLVAADQESRDMWESIKRLADQGAHSNRLERIASEGQRQVLKLAQEFIKRDKSEISTPLILDSPFWSLDLLGSSLAAKFIKAIAEKDQVLVFSNRPENSSIHSLLEPKTHVILTRSTRKHLSPIAYNYEFLHEPSTPIRAFVVTEGKTDWKHLKTALRHFQAQGEFQDLNIEFWEYGDEIKMGSGDLLNFCLQYHKLPQVRPIICVFDRDEPGIIRQVSTETPGYKDWGNNVFSFALPIPQHRSSAPNICIEFFYNDVDITRQDSNGRRLFLSSEFDPKSGRHKINRSLNCTTLNKLHRQEVIDSDVFDENNQNIALTKDKFATNILNGAGPFSLVEFTAFKPVFNTIASIVRLSQLATSDMQNIIRSN